MLNLLHKIFTGINHQVVWRVAQAITLGILVLFLALVATSRENAFIDAAHSLGRVLPYYAARNGSSPSPDTPPRSVPNPPVQAQTKSSPMETQSHVSIQESVCASRSVQNTSPAQPPNHSGESFWANGMEYFIVPGQRWDEAKSNAESQGAKLAKIPNLDSNQRLFRAFGDGLWIGLNDHASTGDWSWMDGQKALFMNWAPGQPDGIEPGNHAGQTCAYVFKGGMGKWDNHWPAGDATLRGGIAERTGNALLEGQNYPISIEVINGDWGGSVTENIERVAFSAASQIWRHIRAHKLAKIRIRRGHGAPICLYERGPSGEYQIEINSGSNLWAQIAYQFAHEFTHILEAPPNTGIHWLGEALGETASMFCIRGMAREWVGDPPYPNWKDYAHHLDEYASDLARKAQTTMGSKTIAQWLEKNLPDLEKIDREKIAPVAATLLPVFESDPSGWEAVLYGDWTKRPGEDLATFFLRWRESCPERLRPFIARLESSLR